jgi:hypothetical protein
VISILEYLTKKRFINSSHILPHPLSSWANSRTFWKMWWCALHHHGPQGAYHDIPSKARPLTSLLCRNPSLGLATKAKGLQGCEPRGSREVTSHTPGSVRKCEGVWGSVKEWTLTLPRQLPLWEMESQWTPETLESDCRGQTSMSYDVFYIIGNLLKRRCLKLARIAHLDIWNTSYGQKKRRESNCQFDSWPQKV